MTSRAGRSPALATGGVVCDPAGPGDPGAVDLQRDRAGEARRRRLAVAGVEDLQRQDDELARRPVQEGVAVELDL